MRLFSKVRDLRLWQLCLTSLIVGGGTGLLITAFSGKDWVSNVAIGAGLVFATLALVTRRFGVRAVTITLIFVVSQAIPATVLYSLQASLSSEYSDSDVITALRLPLIAAFYASVVVVTAIVYNMVAWVVSYGSYLWNMRVSYLLFVTGAAAVLLIGGWPYYVLAGTVGFITGLAYLLLRRVRKGRRPNVGDVTLTVKAKSAHKSVVNVLNRRGYKVIEDGDVVAAFNKRTESIVVVVPVDVVKLGLQPGGIYVEKTNITPRLEDVLLTLRKYKLVPSVHVVVSKDTAVDSPSQRAMIPRWEQAQRVAGEVLIETISGFNGFLRAQKDLSKPTTRQMKRRILKALASSPWFRKTKETELNSES